MGSWIAHCYYKEENKNTFVLYYPYTSYEQSSVADFRGTNGFLIKKFERDGMEVISEFNLDFWRYFVQTRRDMLLMDENVVKYEIASQKRYYEKYAEENQDEIYISFTEDEEKQGNINMTQMGLNDMYVCIANREHHYLPFGDNIESQSLPDLYRNSDINSRKDAISYLNRRGIKAVRMGASMQKPITWNGCVDYANKYRTEFMDVYLSAKCKFFVSDLSGIIGLSQLFSKPLVITNAALLTTRDDSPPFLRPNRDLAIPKKMWDSKRNKYLTLKEILEFEVASKIVQGNTTGVFKMYLDENIIAIENTPNEILNIIREMNDRIDGMVHYDDIDEELQNKYWNIVKNYPLGENILSLWRVGRDFLRDNQWWLK